MLYALCFVIFNALVIMSTINICSILLHTSLDPCSNPFSTPDTAGRPDIDSAPKTEWLKI